MRRALAQLWCPYTWIMIGRPSTRGAGADNPAVGKNRQARLGVAHESRNIVEGHQVAKGRRALLASAVGCGLQPWVLPHLRCLC